MHYIESFEAITPTELEEKIYTYLDEIVSENPPKLNRIYGDSGVEYEVEGEVGELSVCVNKNISINTVMYIVDTYIADMSDDCYYWENNKNIPAILAANIGIYSQAKMQPNHIVYTYRLVKIKLYWEGE